MKTIKYCLFILMLLPASLMAQKSNLWLSYSHTPFVHSPGLEMAYFFTPRIGIQSGINSAFLSTIDPEQVVSPPEEQRSYLFHNLNLGACFWLLEEDEHRLGATLGLKVFLGPHYELLHYYEEGDYGIYYNSDYSFAQLGSDWGLFYTYKHYSFLLKYNTVYHNVRAGIGWTFY